MIYSFSYFLNMICLIPQILYKISYIYDLYNFGTVLYQFILFVSVNPRDSQVLVYTPFHFSFTVPLIEKTFLSHSGFISCFLQIFHNPFIPSFFLSSFIPSCFLPTFYFHSNLLLFSK